MRKNYFCFSITCRATAAEEEEEKSTPSWWAKKREKPRKQQRDGGTQPTIDHAPGPSPWLSFFFLAEKTRDLLPPNWFSMQDKGGSIVQTRRFIFSTIEKENAPQGPLDYPVGNSFRACKGRGKQPPIFACLSLLLLLSCLLCCQ